MYKTWRDEATNLVHKVYFVDHGFGADRPFEGWVSDCNITRIDRRDVYYTHRRPLTCLACASVA